MLSACSERMLHYFTNRAHLFKNAKVLDTSMLGLNYVPFSFRRSAEVILGISSKGGDLQFLS